MSSKQSCFKTIVKCDLKRSWWIGALAALTVFMTSTTQLFSYSRVYYDSYYRRYDGMVDFCEEMFGNYVVGMMVAAFSVLFLFSYVNKVNSVSFFHSLPVTRNTLMLSHIVSSAIIIVAPMLLNTVISLFAVGKGFKASWILMSFVMYLLYSFVVFSLTLLISMLTGVSIASAIFTGVAALLPLFLLVFVSELCYTYFFGYTDQSHFEDFLLKYVYLSPEALTSPRMIVYILVIAAFVALSFFVYKKRHLENHSEVIAFPKLKGLFEVLFALCSGILGYYYFEGFWGITSILTMLVFGALGAVIAHMIANKSLSLKGILRPLLVTVGIILLLFVVFFFDIFGFERRIPDIDDIEYAEIDGIYYDDYSYVDPEYNGQARIKVKIKDPYKPYYTSKEDLENFLKLHRYAVEHIKENEDCDDDFFTSSYLITNRDHVQIKYKLKNGKTMTRSYQLPENDLQNLIYDIYNSDVYKKWKYPVIDGTPKIYKRVEIFDARNYDNNKGRILFASDEELGQIIAALEKDKKSLPYEVMQLKNSRTFVSIDVYYTKTYVSDEGKEYQVEHIDTYHIDEYDVNTWSLLEKSGYFTEEQKLSSNDVVSVSAFVEEYNVKYDYSDNEIYSAASAADIEVAVASTVEYRTIMKYKEEYRDFTDKQQVEELFSFYMTHQNKVVKNNVNYAKIVLELNLKDNSTRSRTVIVSEEDLPETLGYVKDLFLQK